MFQHILKEQQHHVAILTKNIKNTHTHNCIIISACKSTYYKLKNKINININKMNKNIHKLKYKPRKESRKAPHKAPEGEGEGEGGGRRRNKKKRYGKKPTRRNSSNTKYENKITNCRYSNAVKRNLNQRIHRSRPYDMENISNRNKYRSISNCSTSNWRKVLNYKTDKVIHNKVIYDDIIDEDYNKDYDDIDWDKWQNELDDLCSIYGENFNKNTSW